MSHSPELIEFKKDFEIYTQIKVDGVIEERTFPHWKRLVINDLDADRLTIISGYLKMRFKTQYRSAEIHSYRYLGYNYQVLTVDVDMIKKHIMK